MEPMRGIDAKFLYSETPTAHMHTLKVVVADVADSRTSRSTGSSRSCEAQLDHLPPFRRRAVPGPGGLGHPVWVEDPDFDCVAT